MGTYRFHYSSFLFVAYILRILLNYPRQELQWSIWVAGPSLYGGSKKDGVAGLRFGDSASGVGDPKPYTPKNLSF